MASYWQVAMLLAALLLISSLVLLGCAVIHSNLRRKAARALSADVLSRLAELDVASLRRLLGDVSGPSNLLV